MYRGERNLQRQGVQYPLLFVTNYMTHVHGCVVCVVTNQLETKTPVSNFMAHHTN